MVNLLLDISECTSCTVTSPTTQYYFRLHPVCVPMFAIKTSSGEADNKHDVRLIANNLSSSPEHQSPLTTKPDNNCPECSSHTVSSITISPPEIADISNSAAKVAIDNRVAVGDECDPSKGLNDSFTALSFSQRANLSSSGRVPAEPSLFILDPKVSLQEIAPFVSTAHSRPPLGDLILNQTHSTSSSTPSPNPKQEGVRAAPHDSETDAIEELESPAVSKLISEDQHEAETRRRDGPRAWLVCTTSFLNYFVGVCPPLSLQTRPPIVLYGTTVQ